ncbi:MAG: AGE family epimerase/isomerase [FCB group bacterium]|jgi:N-acylglucosamine 2-epimerase|nr:AGE family epimerase/isomerase [FCB group bacterium]
MPNLTTPQGRRDLLHCYRDGLLNDTVPFWFPRGIDAEHGGFLHCLDRDGTLIDTDKSVWAQGRMSWMLLTLYNTVEQRPEWLQWAQSGLEFLDRHCFDTDGRMFFHVTQVGRPIRKRRYAFSECFAAIAHAAHFKATGDERSATRARELFDFFTRWNFTPGLMPPKFADTRPMIGMGPRMITIVTAQELRANLGDAPYLTEWIDRCIDEIRRYFLKPDLRVVMEAVAPDGGIVDHFDGRILNPGHAIEGAWFIMLEGKHRNDPTLIRLGCDMLDWMWERGWDPEHGGLFYFRDLYNKPVQEYWHDMKFWWPHDETIIATLMAYELTGDEKYARWHQQVHDWSHRHFADPEHGEWFGYLRRDGQPSTTTKGNLWKSFFHHPRMQWFCAHLLTEAKTKPVVE